VTHDVFISYSNHDKAVADALCATLESRKIRCWIAPRDIIPGVDYAAALIENLSSSRLLVLIFSRESNNSAHVSREVERAVSKEIPIIPLRIENVTPSKAMEYYLSTPHWLDALTPPLEKHLQTLADTIQIFLENKKEEPSIENHQEGRLESSSKKPEESLFENSFASGDVFGSIEQTTSSSKAFVRPPTSIDTQVTSVNTSSQCAFDYVPMGIANIKLSDQSQLKVMANSLVFLGTRGMFMGLPCDLYGQESVVLFEEMKLLKLEKDKAIALMLDDRTLSLTPPYASACALFAPTIKERLNWERIDQVSFDYSSNYEPPIAKATVRDVIGQSFKTPAESILFVEKYDWKWKSGVDLESGGFLPFKKMKQLQIMDNSKNTNTPVNIATTGGLVIKGFVKRPFESLVYGVNALGVFRLNFQTELKSIDFNCTP
jgi:hypothetical protein